MHLCVFDRSHTTLLGTFLSPLCSLIRNLTNGLLSELTGGLSDISVPSIDAGGVFRGISSILDRFGIDFSVS